MDKRTARALKKCRLKKYSVSTVGNVKLPSDFLNKEAGTTEVYQYLTPDGDVLVSRRDYDSMTRS